MSLETSFGLLAVALIAAGYAAQLARGAANAGLITGVCFGAAAVIACSIAHYALFKPMRRLAKAARAVVSGDFTTRLRFVRRDEIGNLAFEMDALCDQLEVAQLATETHLAALDQLRHADRISTLGRLASSVAHELGNPLSVIELRAQLITSGDIDTPQKMQRNAEVIVEQAQRMTGIIDQILSFARMQPANITRLDLASVLRQAVALSEHTAKKHRTQIALALPAAAVEIAGDPNKLLQVVINLVVNGVQAMPNGGKLDLSVRNELRAPIDDPEGVPRDFVCIDVVDHGIGIAPDLQSRVFEPFFSTRGSQGGTGLGLSVAQGIAREHDGWISVESELGTGSSFKVHLPRAGVRQDTVV